MHNLDNMPRKLPFAVVLSSLWLSLWAAASVAHELQPAIVDVTVTEGEVSVAMSLSLEAYLSGIDLDDISNTDDAAEAEVYDRLRALSPDALTERLPDLIARWNDVPILRSGGEPVELSLTSADIPPVGNEALRRVAEIELGGRVTGESVVLTWPDGAGEVLVREQGVDDPYTGFLFGGQSAPELGSDGQPRSGLAVLVEPVASGFAAVLPGGTDHALFALALFFFTSLLGPLVLQLGTFGVAIGLGLVLATLAGVSLPGGLVAPLVAVSLVYVAVENLFVRQVTIWRPVAGLVFGLVHGFALADDLAGAGVTSGQAALALPGFLLGVGAGLLCVVAAAAALVWLSADVARRADLPAFEAAVEDRLVVFRALSIPVSLIIATLGIYWTVERIFT